MTHTLRFTGAQQQARPELTRLLREFPQAFFQERELTEYVVTADPQTLQALSAKPDWELQAR